ncbi:MAG TPA: protein-export chaperone SecB [Halothiobacillus sp.]|nr:protein-export chaperone SecB [Halothiobacillus sp.]
MAEQENGVQASAEKQLFIQKIYLKDVSFESPNSPKSFLLKEWNPEVNVQVGNAAVKVGDNTYEVALTITVTATQDEQTLYLVEVQYAGIFVVSGLDQEELQHALGAYCPSLLLPYIRETVSDLITKGGFPQFLLQPINFDALYLQHRQQQEAQAQADGANVSQNVQ